MMARMDLEPPRTSAALRQRHWGTVYRPFFASCDLVASAPGVFFWAGEHSILNGGLAICQHAPLRAYVGLSFRPRVPTDVHTVDFSKDPQDHLWYEPAEDNFFAFPWSRKFPQNEVGATGSLETALNEPTRRLDRRLLKRLETNRPKLVCRILTLSELRTGSGANWSGAFATALAGVLALASEDDWPAGEATLARQLRSLGRLSTKRPVSNADRPRLARVWALNDRALEFESILHSPPWKTADDPSRWKNASGYGTLCSLVPEALPLVYFLRRPGDSVASDQYSCRCLLDAEARDLFGITYGLMSSGQMRSTWEAIDRVEAEADPEEWQDTLARAKEWAADAWEPPPIEENKPSLRAGLQVRVTEVWDALRKMGTPQRENTHSDGSPVTHLARLLREVQGGLTQLGLDWSQGYVVASEFYAEAMEHGIFDEAAIKLTGGGRGGELVFMLPSKWSEGETRGVPPLPWTGFD